MESPDLIPDTEMLTACPISQIVPAKEGNYDLVVKGWDVTVTGGKATDVGG